MNVNGLEINSWILFNQLVITLSNDIYDLVEFPRCADVLVILKYFRKSLVIRFSYPFMHPSAPVMKFL